MGKMPHKVLQIVQKQLKNSQQPRVLGCFIDIEGEFVGWVRQGFSAFADEAFLGSDQSLPMSLPQRRR